MKYPMVYPPPPPIIPSGGTPSASTISILILIILFIVIPLAGGILAYFFIFKCKDEDGECTTTSDCCKNLTCIDSKCKKETTTTTTPAVISNCGEWDDQETSSCWPEGYSVPSGFRNREGNTIEECCRGSCSEWFSDGNTCVSKLPMPGETLGYSEGECCEDGMWYRGEAGKSCHEVCYTLTTATKYCHLENDITSRENLEKVMEAIGFDSSQCTEWSEGTTATCIENLTDGASSNASNKSSCESHTNLKDSVGCLSKKDREGNQICKYIPAPILSYDGNGKCSYLSGSNLTNNELIGNSWASHEPGKCYYDENNWLNIGDCVGREWDDITGDNNTEKCETCGAFHVNKKINNYCSRKIDDEQPFCKCNNDKDELRYNSIIYTKADRKVETANSRWVPVDYFKIGAYHNNSIRYADGATTLKLDESNPGKPVYEDSSGSENSVWTGTSLGTTPFGLEGSTSGDEWQIGLKSDFNWTPFKCSKDRRFQKHGNNNLLRCIKREDDNCSDWSTTSTCPPGTTLTPDGIAYGDTAAECCGPFSVFQERWNRDYGI